MERVSGYFISFLRIYYILCKHDDKYQLKIDDTNGIIYRGKLIATDQDPQEFKQTNDLYYYE